MLHYWPILLLAPGGRQIDPNIDGVERPPWVDAKGIGSTLLVFNPPHRSVSPKNKPNGANAAPFRSSTAHSAFNSFLLPLPPPALFCRHSAAVRERCLLPKADAITATLSKWSCCFLLHDIALRTYKVLRWVSVILAPVSKHAKCRGMVHCRPFRC